MKLKLLGATAMALALAGCGSSQPDRTTGGAGAGAATGAVIGAVGGPVGVGAGALIGAGVGAATGAATTPNQVNLGTPPWDNPETRVAGEPVGGRGRSVRRAAASRHHVTHAAARTTHRVRRPTGTNAGAPAPADTTAPPPAAPAPAPAPSGTTR